MGPVSVTHHSCSMSFEIAVPFIQIHLKTEVLPRRSGPQRVNATCLEPVLMNYLGFLQVFSALLSSDNLLLFTPLVWLECVCYRELLILVCECAFSFRFLDSASIFWVFLFVILIDFPPFVIPSFSFSDSACPCIPKDSKYLFYKCVSHLL